jgi:6-pyruvoyltetrahydropterin/6-carboxytetrahydropterin synthase
MFEISVTMDFSAAHNLRGYRGKCEEFHGHNWKVQVSLASCQLGKIGMVEDFKAIKQRLKDILALVDHKYLNSLPYFRKDNPTSENIAKFIYERMKVKRKVGRPKVLSVKVWETEQCAAMYYEE